MTTHSNLHSPFELDETVTHSSHNMLETMEKTISMDVMQSMMKTMQDMSVQMSVVADKLDNNMSANPQQQHKMYKYKMQMQEHLDKSKQTQEDPSKHKHHMQNHMHKMKEMMEDMKMARMNNSHSESFESQGSDHNMMKSKHHKEIDQRLDDIETLLEQILQHQTENLK